MDAQGPDQKLTLRRGENAFRAQGQWQHGRWRVLMKNRRAALAKRDVAFTEGVPVPVSFANWDGSNGEALYRHTRSPWYWLVLTPQAAKADNSLAEGVGVAIGVFLLGLVLMRGQRRGDR